MNEIRHGPGYVEGEARWRFIGAYLIYGQWKQGIVAGVKHLASAYVVTGDSAYAHKAAILLDRIADLYPTFDFKTQAAMYEGPAAAGYVSTWHDACWVRFADDGTPQTITLWQGQHAAVGNVKIMLRARVDFIQIDLARGEGVVVAGDATQLAELRGLPP